VLFRAHRGACSFGLRHLMNIFSTYEAEVSSALRKLVAAGELPHLPDTSRIVVEPPRDASMGDLASNAAMVLAKELGMNPRALAEKLVKVLQQSPGVARAVIAGPGFINLTLDPGIFHAAMRASLTDMGYGRGTAKTGAGKVNVEYVSANPTGPMHVGHGRGAVFGDALASLLAFAGYDVTREYYINDAGAQVDDLARSAYLRYREALGEEIGEIPAGLYPGDYIKPIGYALVKAHGKALLGRPESEWLSPVRDLAIAMMMEMIRADLAALNVQHDVFFSERSLQEGGSGGKVMAAIEALRRDDLVYLGRLPPPKGAPSEDWEEREQTLFRATAFGDDVDRPLLKADGGFTYFASDIAYHASKFERGFTTQIDVWGADHGGYIKRLSAAVKAVSGGQAVLDVKLVQLVRLLRNGEPVKMSKRSGEFITLREVVDEVGVDAVRFMMLYRKNDAALDFDLAKVIEQSKDNPVFYVQYAHARCCSIFRQAREALGHAVETGLETANLGALTHPGEVALIKTIALYPRLIEQAAQAHEPHRLAFYLYDLASQFHAQWNQGKDEPALRFVIVNDLLLTPARLALVKAVETILRSGLAILGVASPEEMR
jgi:arginyl-tRNA synthetase